MLPIWNLPGIKECSVPKNDAYPWRCHCPAWGEFEGTSVPLRCQSPFTRGLVNTLSTTKPSKDGFGAYSVLTAHLANQLSQLSPFESRGVNTVLLTDVAPAHADRKGVPLAPVGYKYQFIALSLLNRALYGPFVAMVPLISLSLMYSNTKTLGLIALI